MPHHLSLVAICCPPWTRMSSPSLIKVHSWPLSESGLESNKSTWFKILTWTHSILSLTACCAMIVSSSGTRETGCHVCLFYFPTWPSLKRSFCRILSSVERSGYARQHKWRERESKSKRVCLKQLSCSQFHSFLSKWHVLQESQDFMTTNIHPDCVHFLHKQQRRI